MLNQPQNLKQILIAEAREAQSQGAWLLAQQKWQAVFETFPDISPQIRAASIYSLLELENFEAAEFTAQSLLENHSEHPAGYEWLARIAQRQRHWELALARWNVFFLKFPECSVQCHVARIQTLMELSRFSELENAAQQLINAYPDQQTGFEWSARAVHRLQNWVLALKRWENLINQFPDSPNLFRVYRIQCLMELARYDEADVEIIHLIKVDPDNPLGYEWLARLAQRQHHWDQALERWQYLLNRFPNSPLQFKVYLIQSLMELSRFSEAETSALSLIASHPDFPSGYEWYSRAAQRQRQWSLALDRWEKLFSLFPDTPLTLLVCKIQPLIELSRFEEAETYAKSLMATHPDCHQGYEWSARIARSRLQRELALARWSRIMTQFPEVHEAYAEVGTLLLDLMQFDRAKQHYAIIEERFSNLDNKWSQTQQALFYEKLEAYDKALTYWESILEVYPDTQNALTGKCRCLIKTRCYDQAEALLQKINQRFPWQIAAMANLVTLYRSRGDDQYANTLITDFCKKYPENPDLIILKFHCCLEVMDLAAAMTCLQKLQHLQKASEIDDKLIFSYEQKRNWAKIFNNTPEESQQFSISNRYFMALLALKKKNLAEKKLTLCKEKVGLPNWFDHHYALFLNQSGYPEEALSIWQDIKSPKRDHLIGMMEAAWKLSDYQTVRRVCLDYAGLFPMNTVAKMYCEKSSVLLNQSNSIPSATYKIEKPEERVTFLHGGDLGDLIFALPLFKKFGNVHLFLTTTFVTREALDHRIDIIKELLLSQNNIAEVALWDGENITYDLTGFRANRNLAVRTLTESQANYLFGDESIDIDSPWLTFNEVEKHERVVFARSFRYRNPNWDALWPLFKKLYPDAIFVGLEEEHKDFGSGEFIKTNNLYKVAKIIAGASLFIGNQSAPFAIAEGLKVNRILEACHYCPNGSYFKQTPSLF